MVENRQDDRGTFESVGEAVGGFAGKAAGRAADMATGVATSLLSAAGQMLGGWWTGPDASRAANAFNSDQDRRCQEHFRSAGSEAAGDYDSARPLYQFGFVARQNPDFQNRSFRDVEPELERAWTGEPSSRYGSWSEVREFVGYGYGDSATGGF